MNRETGLDRSDPLSLRNVDHARVLCQHFMVGLGGWRLNVVKPGLGAGLPTPPFARP